MSKISTRQVTHLVRYRVKRALEALDSGRVEDAQESTRRAGQYVRVLQSMTSDPDLLQRCQSLGDLLRDALQGLQMQDEAAADYLDFALAETGVTLRSFPEA